MAAPSKVWVWCRSPAEIADSNLAEGINVRLFECYVLFGRGLCDGLITSPEESYRLRVSVNVIARNSNI